MASIEVSLDIICLLTITFVHVVGNILCSSRDSES
jgi:hypothetical protein